VAYRGIIGAALRDLRVRGTGRTHILPVGTTSVLNRLVRYKPIPRELWERSVPIASMPSRFNIRSWTAVPLIALLSVGCEPHLQTNLTDPLDTLGLPKIVLRREAEIGGNDMRTDYLLSSVRSAAFLADGSIAIACGMDEEIKLFSEEGVLLMSLGGEGGGPGEFRQLTDVVGLPDGRILAWDIQLRRATYFLSDGEVEQTISPRFDGLDRLLPPFIGVLSDRRLVFRDFPSTMDRRGELAGRKRDTVLFAVFSSDGSTWEKITSVIGPQSLFYNGGGAWGTEDLLFGRELYAAVSNDRLFLADSDSLAILSFGFDGRPGGTLSLQRPPRLIEPKHEVLEKDRRMREAEQLLATQNRLLRVTGNNVPDFLALARDRLETLEVLPSLPAFTGFIPLGEDGFWIRESEYPGTPIQRWYRLSADFEPMGWIQLDPQEELLAAAGTRILVLSKDELDVESVILFGEID